MAISNNLISKKTILLSVIAAILTSIASLAGVFSDIYSKETLSWSAQGIGQDVISLILVVPLLLICTFLLSKNSIKSLLIWMGIMIYLIYSYVLYAFTIHFGWIYLVYVALLGVSFYSLISALVGLDYQYLAKVFSTIKRYRHVSIYLMICGIMFYFLWLSGDVYSIILGTVPKEVIEIGLPVNPVHVLDMAFLLPGMIIASALLWRRNLLGQLFAIPLMVFAQIMGIAIISMAVALSQKGISSPIQMMIIMGIMISINFALTMMYLREIGKPEIIIKKDRI